VKALPPDKSAERNEKSAGGGQNGNGRAFAPGHDPRRGHGPAPGTGGRPRSEFRARMAELCKSTVPEEILAPIAPEVLEKLLLLHPGVYLDLQRLREKTWVDMADRAFNRPASQPTDDDEREQRFFQGVPILDMDEWRKMFAAGNQP